MSDPAPVTTNLSANVTAVPARPTPPMSFDTQGAGTRPPNSYSTCVNCHRPAMTRSGTSVRVATPAPTRRSWTLPAPPAVTAETAPSKTNGAVSTVDAPGSDGNGGSTIEPSK